MRVVYVVGQTRLHLFDATFVASDSLFYLRLASSIAAGEGMSVDGEPTAFVGPGYPLFLAPLVAAGADALTIGVVQSALGAITVGMVAFTSWWLARGAAPGRATAAAVAAGVVAAFYPHLVFWTGYVLTETLFVALLAAGIALLVVAWDARSWPYAFAAGLAFGLAAITRPPALAIALGLIAWWLLAGLVRRRGVAPALVFAAGLLLPVGAWTARNVAELGAPIVTSSESGYVFYQGNSLRSSGGSRGYVDSLDFTPLDLPADLGEIERDRIYLAQALADMSADPIRVIARWPAKLGNMWRPTYEGSSVRNTVITLATYPLVLVAGAGGALLLMRRGPFDAMCVPALFVLGWALLHVLVTGMIRFRVAAEMVFIVAMPFALFWAWDRVRERRHA